MQQTLLASLLEENRMLRQENLTLLSELAQGSQDSTPEGLLEELEQARQANDALQRSTSWRVTAPLRAIGRSMAVGRRYLNDSIRPRLRYAKVARSEPFQPRLFSNPCLDQRGETTTTTSDSSVLVFTVLKLLSDERKRHEPPQKQHSSSRLIGDAAQVC
jgi:hypothetical protein